MQKPTRPQRDGLDWPAWFAPWTGLVVRLQARIQEGRRRMREEPDAGYTTETVVVTALLIALAVAVIGILVAKITEKAKGINLG